MSENINPNEKATEEKEAQVNKQKEREAHQERINQHYAKKAAKQARAHRKYLGIRHPYIDESPPEETPSLSPGLSPTPSPLLEEIDKSEHDDSLTIKESSVPFIQGFSDDDISSGDEAIQIPRRKRKKEQ